MMILIDQSLSMGAKFAEVQTAAKQLIGHLDLQHDQVGIAGFGRGTKWVNINSPQFER